MLSAFRGAGAHTALRRRYLVKTAVKRSGAAFQRCSVGQPAGVLGASAAGAPDRVSYTQQQPCLVQHREASSSSSSVFGSFTENIKNSFQSATSRFQGKVEKKKSDREEESQRISEGILLENLKTSPTFDFTTYYGMMKELLDKQVSGWQQYVPGALAGDREKAKESIAMTKNIIECMSEKERKTKVDLDEDSMVRIAALAGVQLKDVSDLNDGVNGYKQTHKWMQRRKKLGLGLPDSFIELNTMMALDKKGMPASVPRWRIEAIKKEKGWKTYAHQRNRR